MMNISSWAFDNKKLIHFLIAVLIVGGLFAAYDMSKFEDPEIKVKQALVITAFPGASASQVELQVTDPLEKEIRKMPDIFHVESYSFNDVSFIQVELRSTVPEGEIEQHWDQLRRKVNNAAANLPNGCYTPQVKDDFSSVNGMFLAMSGDGMGDTELGRWAEMTKRELLAIEGVDCIDIYGERKECINVELKQAVMASLGVKPAEVLATLRGQNATTYSGYFDHGNHRIRISTEGKLEDVQSIRDMLLQGHEGDQLRIKDIATVEKGYEEPSRSELFYDGERSIGILIAATSNSDVVKVGKAVQKKIDELQKTRYPAGIQVNKVFFQPEKVSEALGTFFINLVESVAIVIVILMFAMGVRSGLIIAVSLVTIVLGSLLFLYGMDGTMQRVSLASFILAMGMLVDNAIVIIDGILVDLNKGVPMRKALTDIGGRTAMPLLGATLIAILAFLPIFLSPDTTGLYVRDLFIVLAVSLLLSWILALVHVPLLSEGMAKKTLAQQKDKSEKEEDLFKGKAYDWLGKSLEWALTHRTVTIAGMVVLLFLTLLGYRQMRQGFFPDMSYNQLYIEYKLPESTDNPRVASDLEQMRQWLGKYPQITHITTSLGGSPGRYNLVRSVATPSLAYGELIVDFKSPKELNRLYPELQDSLSVKFPDAYLRVKKYNLMYRKYPIEAQLTGPDIAVLERYADSIRNIMEESGKIMCITRDLEPQVPVLRINFDQSSALRMGLGRNDVSISLLAANGGVPIGNFYEGIHSQHIYVKLVDEKGGHIDDMEDIPVFAMLPTVASVLDNTTLNELLSGTISKDELVSKVMATTPLRQVVNGIDADWEYPVIPRYDGQRMVRVQGSPKIGLETERTREEIAKKIEKLDLPAGYKLTWQGEKNASDESMKYLFKMFPMAIILMIFILILLFKDYRRPIIILCTIPCCLVGVVATMLVTQMTFTFCAIVGALGLIGMVIKNGIVLMDEINLQISSGLSQKEALIRSAKSRLRPVSMAALTTILGMLPLLTDAMFGSMAAAIMGGLTFGTIVTLVFVPVLYSLFFKEDK